MNIHFPPELAEHLAGQARVERRRYRKKLARCRKKLSGRAVHALRTETRRVLALLDLLDALRSGNARLRKIFKKRLDAFDDLRDTQVQQKLLKPMWRDFPEACDFKDNLRRREKRCVSKLSKKIKSARHARLTRGLKEIEECLRRGSASSERGDTVALTVLEAAFHRVGALRLRIRGADAAAIHRMRVAFKEFRYLCELLEPLLPRLTRKQLKDMKSFQSAAGGVQDLEVLLKRLDCEISDGHLSAPSVKNLHRELLRRRRDAVNSFLARADGLFQFEPVHWI